jgi:hypothetical protein
LLWDLGCFKVKTISSKWLHCPPYFQDCRELAPVLRVQEISPGFQKLLAVARSARIPSVSEPNPQPQSRGDARADESDHLIPAEGERIVETTVVPRKKQARHIVVFVTSNNVSMTAVNAAIQLVR